MQLTPEQLEFLTERHLATLTTLRSDGSPHVVAIAFTYIPGDGAVSIITNEGSQKVKNVDGSARAAVCQVDGGRWLTLEGRATVHRSAAEIARAEAAFESRYRPPSNNPTRVAIEISVDRLLGSESLRHA